MAATSGSIIGLTLAKIDGTFHLDVRNSRWSNKRNANQVVTGGGVEIAVGEELPSGSFDEVIPKTPGFNWRALKNFRIDIYDKPTRKRIVASFEGCEWTGIDGSSDNQAANATKAITWVGRKVNVS